MEALGGAPLITFTMVIDGANSNTAPFIISYTRQRSLNPYKVASLNFAPWLADTMQLMQAVPAFIGRLLVKWFGVRITILIGCLFHSWAVLLDDCWRCNAVILGCGGAVWSSERSWCYNCTIITVVSAVLVPMLLHQFTNSLAEKGRCCSLEDFVVLQSFLQLLELVEHQGVEHKTHSTIRHESFDAESSSYSCLSCTLPLTVVMILVTNCESPQVKGVRSCISLCSVNPSMSHHTVYSGYILYICMIQNWMFF